MYTQRSKYWPAYTWKIQTSYLKEFEGKVSGSLKVSKENFKSRYFSIFHKINASFYHLQRLKEAQGVAIKMGEELAKLKIPGMEKRVGIAGSPYEPINYEYEAFLVTIKSALDFIAALILDSFGQKGDTIRYLMGWVKKRKSIDKNSLEEKVCSLLESEDTNKLITNYWDTSGKKTKRNFTVHRGSLPTGTTNVPINSPCTPVLPTKALDPNDPHHSISLRKAEDLVDFCENEFCQTCDLLIDILSLLTGKSLSPGPKTSVYEQSQ